MPARLLLLLAGLLLCACAGPLARQSPPRLSADLPTAVVARPTNAAELLPTANPAVIDKPILDDLAATARAAAPTPTVATPTPPTPRVSVQLRPPARIVIGAIALDRPLLAVGLDQESTPIVPKHDAGWFTGSAVPGQGDNVVLWGHALRFRDSPDVPAPFGRLSELKPGASIVLYDDQGGQHDYTLTRQVWATPDQVDYILPQGRERLTLISCIGQQVIAGDGAVVSMSHRLVTIAEPAQVALR